MARVLKKKKKKKSPFCRFSFQEASVNVWLQFSDDTASLLSSFSDLPSFLSLSSLAETVVAVPPGQSRLVYAEGDGGGPLLFAELLVSICHTRQAASGPVGQADGVEPGGTRMLAKGSGWIRVNLDLGFLPKPAEGSEFDVDISDIPVESDRHLYVSNGNKFRHRNVSSDYKIGNRVARGETVDGNHLERAVQMPGKEESAVHFSSSHEKKQGWTEDKRQQEDAPDLEVGVGAVLSLLGIFAVLFLANCLPSALRGSPSSKQEQGEPRPAAQQSAGRKEAGDEGTKQQEDSDEDVKVELAC